MSKKNVFQQWSHLIFHTWQVSNLIIYLKLLLTMRSLHDFPNLPHIQYMYLLVLINMVLIVLLFLPLN